MTMLSDVTAALSPEMLHAAREPGYPASRWGRTYPLRRFTNVASPLSSVIGSHVRLAR
ncbi:hypothetical protein [Streptomyces dangxiongensis]|uniref:hypothetical protein n=1 Tax=Streptomyces dangxiongensis TaxID=1442032 RepID=UPI0013CE437E|nr:hypothetical protein [Streptomyces dangxiongensis]